MEAYTGVKLNTRCLQRIDRVLARKFPWSCIFLRFEPPAWLRRLIYDSVRPIFVENCLHLRPQKIVFDGDILDHSGYYYCVSIFSCCTYNNYFANTVDLEISDFEDMCVAIENDALPFAKRMTLVRNGRCAAEQYYYRLVTLCLIYDACNGNFFFAPEIDF